MSRTNSDYPFKQLGNSLKQMRVRRRETIIEVSGAVEIDAETLSTYETGADRPSEDVLMLLISYFSIKEEEASKLWDMAGYSREQMRADDVAPQSADPAAVLVMPMDLRIVYTDMVHVVVNDFGLVMNFMQTAGPANKPLAIARVGMSREHARSVLEVLQRTLAQSEPRRLPAPKTDQRSDDQSKS